MNATALAVSRKTSRTPTILLLGTLALLALWFIARRALPYSDFSQDHYGPYFWPRRWWLVLHIAGGVTALSVGVLQLWLGLTNRISAWHRALGKAYVTAIALGSIGAFYLALTIPGNAPYAAGLFSLCVAWVITTSMAVFAIRRRKIPQHREWMMRSYAVTFAFVTFRFGVDALIARHVAPADAQAIMAWACWAAPLLLLEPLLQFRKLSSTSA
jgi:uncharacterized membrane protein